MATMLETPSRVWRRIQDVEGRDMPSLPSLPAFEDSADQPSEAVDEDSDTSHILNEANPIHSTPAAFSSHTATSTIRPPSSTGSTARFANSLASRSSKSSLSVSRASGAGRQSLPPPDDSFDISSIPSLPNMRDVRDDELDIRSSDQETEHTKDSSVPDAYLPPETDHDIVNEDELDITDALQSVSRSGSPAPGDIEPTPRRKSVYDYSMSLRSEPKSSPFDKLRNISFRRPTSRNSRTQARTPSLSRSTPSPESSTSHSTPHSTRSPFPSQPGSPLPALAIPLPRSATASPTAAFSPRQYQSQRQEAHPDYAQESHDLSHVSASQSERDMSVETDIHTEHTEQSEQSASHDHTTNQDEREPTFSSEEGFKSSSRDISGNNGHASPHLPSPAQVASAFSSPTPSITFTPTPAFQPRPRARFNLPPQASTTPQDEYPEEESHEDEEPTWRPEHQDHEVPLQDDPATPYAHKRSFLLSVINSTARPRMKFPTPHPHRAGNESSAQLQEPMTPGVNLQSAFAGVTPRPRVPTRRRLSHPLAQTFTVAGATTDSGSESASVSPAQEHPSFISTTSSQDLTTHARANASFDPVIGLGERGVGVGRFNAGKLNSYLHGLNRKLQEENEGLVARLRAYEETYGSMENRGNEGETSSASPRIAGQVQGRRVSGGGVGRRVSAGPGLGLGDVAEDEAEGWVEEKAALEEMVEELKEQVEACASQKDEVVKILEDERSERARDKERWRARMGEVERGVENIVRELENKQKEAEERACIAEAAKIQTVKEVERRLAEVVVERDVLAERVEQAEAALENGRDLGLELNTANEKVGKATSDLKNANIQIKELEDEVMRADGRIDALEADLKDQKRRYADLQDELDVKHDKLSDTLQHVNSLDDELRAARNELEDGKTYISQLEEDAGAAVGRIETLEKQVRAATQKLDAITDEVDQEKEHNAHLEGELDKASELAKQMEDALEAAEQKMLTDAGEVASLKVKISALERELDKSQSRIEPTHIGFDSEAQADIEALENELADANKEIARLNTILAQSPARKAIEKARDARIEMLEKERDDLHERLKSHKSHTFGMGTPSRLANGSGISPMHRQILSMSFKSPKTPGGPLRDLSWLQSTMQSPSAAPLVAEIERLQQELDRANESIDDKLDRLEDAGVGVISLTNQLEDARAKIVTLEDEIGRLIRREDRRSRRIERIRCQKCRTKVDTRSLVERNTADESSMFDISDISLPSNPPTPPTKTSERLRANLNAVNAQLVSMKNQWEEERSKLIGENAILQNTAQRLNTEVRNAKSEIQRYADTERAGERSRAALQNELEKARRAVDGLEDELREERSRLRSLSTEQTRAERQKDKVELQLRRTESDMSDVKQQLQKVKQENHELEAELRSNTNVEQKARLLESKVAENAENIEHLRQERSLLVADHKNLQQRYSEVSEHVNKLRKEHTASQTSHDKRRHQLDLQVIEIEDLRRALSNQADELQRAEEEKKRIASEKSDVARTVATLEADLRRVKRDAEAFGRDLKTLRTQKERLEAERKEEKEKADRAQKQSRTEIRLLNEELQGQKEKFTVAEQKVKVAEERVGKWKGHVCAADERQLTGVKLQHKEECKGLIVQIRYLKAKFTRESTLRGDLGYQKRYLLALLARSERTEQKILAAIAQIGFPEVKPPSPSQASRKRTLKTIVLSVVFIRRAGRASEVWRQQSASKEAVAAALQEVRRRRTTNPSGSSSGSKPHRPPDETH